MVRLSSCVVPVLLVGCGSAAGPEPPPRTAPAVVEAPTQEVREGPAAPSFVRGVESPDARIGDDVAAALRRTADGFVAELDDAQRARVATMHLEVSVRSVAIDAASVRVEVAAVLVETGPPERIVASLGGRSTVSPRRDDAADLVTAAEGALRGALGSLPRTLDAL